MTEPITAHPELDQAPAEPNDESRAAMAEGDGFLASGRDGRFDSGADLIAAALTQ